MNDPRKECIAKALKEGKFHQDVRMELISNGFDTKNFDELYIAVQNELGIVEPQIETRAEAPYITGERDIKETAAQPMSHRRRMTKNLVKIGVGVFVLTVVAIIAAGYMDFAIAKAAELFGISPEERVPTADIARQTQIFTLQKSAELYRNKMTDYIGVCESIGIDVDVFSCNDSNDAYAIETELSSGDYYCVDSTPFSGVVFSSIGTATVCP